MAATPAGMTVPVACPLCGAEVATPVAVAAAPERSTPTSAALALSPDPGPLVEHVRTHEPLQEDTCLR